MKQYLAIDIGGTAVKLGIVDEEGRVLSRTEQSVCFDNYETPIPVSYTHLPGELHKPGVARPGCAHVRKAVIKIRMED